MATFIVTTLADSGAGRFRAAINQANASADADEVVFDIAGTIMLESALPTITANLTVDGGNTMTIDANAEG